MCWRSAGASCSHSALPWCYRSLWQALVIVSLGWSSDSFTSCLIMLPMKNRFPSELPLSTEVARKQSRQVYLVQPFPKEHPRGSDICWPGREYGLRARGAPTMWSWTCLHAPFGLCPERLGGLTLCHVHSGLHDCRNHLYQPHQPRGQPGLPPSPSDANFPHAVKLMVNIICLWDPARKDIVLARSLTATQMKPSTVKKD